MKNEIWVLQTTLPRDWNEAQVGEWSNNIISYGLAKCIQRNLVTSVYEWKEKASSDVEWRVQIKTSEYSLKELVSSINAEHPYETPQIIYWKAQSTRSFTDWVEGRTL